MANLGAIVLRTDELRQKAAAWCMRVGESSGDLVEVIFRPYKCRRSKEQNALFHVWVRALGKHLGYDEPEMKELAKQELLGHRDVMLKGVQYRITRCTSGLSANEFAQFLNDLERWAAVEHGYRLPPAIHYGYGEDTTAVKGRA